MGLRYRKRIKIAPGLHINLSKSGISLNLGVPGFNTTIGKSSSLNLGIPGSGLSYQHSLKKKKSSLPKKDLSNPIEFEEVYLIPDNIISLSPELINSGELKVINQLYREVIENSERLATEIAVAKKVFNRVKVERILLKFFLIGFIPSISIKIKRKVQAHYDLLFEIQEEQDANFLDLNYVADSEFEELFNVVSEKFIDLQKCERIWDINARYHVDKVYTRSLASANIRRAATRIEKSGLSLVRSNIEPLKFCNTNGSDIYLYPSFAVFKDRFTEKFAAISYSELNIIFTRINFLEEGPIPQDSTRNGETWKMVNKDGSRDKRFKNNYLIPIIQYGQLEFRHDSGLKEVFQFSNLEAAGEFYSEIKKYQRTFGKLK